MNAEQLVVQELKASSQFVSLGAPVSMDVPRNRPTKFVTVERTGGPGDRFRDFPALAVQAWAGTRLEASELADDLVPILRGLANTEHIHRVSVDSVYNFPDPESRQGRYQIVLTLVTK